MKTNNCELIYFCLYFRYSITKPVNLLFRVWSLITKMPESDINHYKSCTIYIEPYFIN